MADNPVACLPGSIMKTRANGIEVHFTVEGQGPWLAMSHALACDHRVWDEQAAWLAQRYTVLRYDTRGHGASDTPLGPYSFDMLAADAIALFDALGIEKAAFMGNSMGGATVLRLAMAHPDRVSHIITMGSGAGGSASPVFQPAGPSEGIKVLQAAYRDPSVEGMRKLVDIMTFSPEFATEELVRQRSEMARSRPDHLANFVNGIPSGRLPMDLSALTRTELIAVRDRLLGLLASGVREVEPRRPAREHRAGGRGLSVADEHQRFGHGVCDLSCRWTRQAAPRPSTSAMV